MDYKISISEDRNYIILQYYVPMTTKVALESGPEMMRLAIENYILKFLFDMRKSQNVQSAGENYFFANRDNQTFGFPRNTRSAFLVRPDDDSHDFITTAFLNAGYRVAQFTHEEEAIKWLLEETPDTQ
jgi:hypothetical protein